MFDLVYMCVTCACLPDMKFDIHFLLLGSIVVFSIFLIRICLGTVSKALFMSIKVRIVLVGGVFWLKPSKICCVRDERWVVVKCNGRNPCLVGESGISVCILFRINLSIILTIFDVNEMGR